MRKGDARRVSEAIAAGNKLIRHLKVTMPTLRQSAVVEEESGSSDTTWRDLLRNAEGALPIVENINKVLKESLKKAKQ